MCWNWQVSLFSFGVILAVSYNLVERNLQNDRLLAFFIMSYGTMQLFETFMWWGQKRDYSFINYIGSIMACMLLYLHPLSILLGMWYDVLYTTVIKSTEYLALFVASCGIFIYGILRTLSLVFLYKSPEYKFISYPDKQTGHLIWDFPNNYNIVLAIALLITFFLIFPLNPVFALTLIAYYFIPVLLLRLLYSNTYKMSDVLLFITGNMREKDDVRQNAHFGSYWCWIVAFFSFFLYFLNPYMQIHLP